jgi:hypothetical protein
MTQAEAIAWLQALSIRGQAIPSADAPKDSAWRHRGEATAWLAEARTALHAVFPANHPIVREWEAIFERAKTYKLMANQLALSEPYANVHFDQAVSVVQAAWTILKDGRMQALIDGVRAETVSEVLDQADALLTANHALAAAVLAGGALETHLLHLCVRNSVTWPGDGSISKYDGAMAQARNTGTVTVYSATDSKLIGAWGKIRNDAAHDPTNFTRTVDEVRRMVEGIREFMARIP